MAPIKPAVEILSCGAVSSDLHRINYTPAREKYRCILQRHATPPGSVICVEEDSFSSRILILNKHGSCCIPDLFEVQGRAGTAGLCGFPSTVTRPKPEWEKKGETDSNVTGY